MHLRSTKLTVFRLSVVHTLEACQKLIDNYVNKGGEIFTVNEGSLGLGTVICVKEGFKTAIIQEHYKNWSSSVHTIRLYNKIPEKYRKLIESEIEKSA